MSVRMNVFWSVEAAVVVVFCCPPKSVLGLKLHSHSFEVMFGMAASYRQGILLNAFLPAARLRCYCIVFCWVQQENINPAYDQKHTHTKKPQHNTKGGYPFRSLS